MRVVILGVAIALAAVGLAAAPPVAACEQDVYELGADRHFSATTTDYARVIEVQVVRERALYLERPIERCHRGECWVDHQPRRERYVTKYLTTFEYDGAIYSTLLSYNPNRHLRVIVSEETGRVVAPFTQ